MKISRAVIFTIIYLFLSDTSFSQDNFFKISGQYRLRPEFRNGYRTLKADSSSPAFFIAQRARLIFDFKKEKISSKISIQDTRTWGDEEPQKDLAGLQVNELWVELALNKRLSLKLGRQELVYDDHRLLGNVEWANVTRSHDAILLNFTNKEKNIQWHLGGAFNQSGEPTYGTSYSIKNYKYLGFSWFKKELPKIHSSLSVIAILNGMNSTDIFSKGSKASLTLGPLFNYYDAKWKFVLGCYYQTGKTENNLSLNAYMLNGYGEFRKSKFFAGIGLDILSGNSDNTKPTKSNNFSTLYATNHKFYGYMDYFLNIPSDTKQRGLSDIYARIGFVQNKNLIVTLDLHSFSLAHENYKGINKIHKALGTEADLLVEYKPSPVINLQVGYSMMFASKNMELIKGGSKNNYNGWAFIMLKVSPTFFTHGFKN